MDKKRAVELLIQAAEEIPHLKTLRHDNDEFRLWLNKVENIIRAGLEPEAQKKYWEASQFLKYLRGVNEEDLIQQDYLDEVIRYEIALKSIIQKYEILGIKEKPAITVGPPEVPEDYKEKVGKELELVLEGTPDMAIECIMSLVRKLKSKDYLYKCTPRTGDAPDFAKQDKTYSARCDVLVARKDGDVKIGTIKLQLLPKERTLFSIQKPEQRDSPLGRFLDQLLGELKRLGFICFKEEVEEMDKYTAIELLKQYLEEITRLRNLPEDNQEWTLWVAKVENVVKAGLEQEDLDTCTSARYESNVIPVWGPEDFGKPSPTYYQENITAKEIAIKKIIQKYEILGIETQPASLTGLPPKAFIAHEGETRALNILKEFLEALGIQYFIAESKASDGRSIEKQVNWTQSKADFAICLATKGKAVNKKTGKHYMAPNIIDELGRARQVFGNKIILLVQKGVEVHTNIREIVYETFTTTNMEKAFIKIARELTNWGFISTRMIKEQT